jgi:GGDEF domain-containing protein
LASFFSNHVQQRWQSQRMEHQQSHDALTGLLNRSHFLSRVGEVASNSSRYAIIVIDVNAFHEINESYGHTAGDALLVEIANALQRGALQGELVSRVGGDLFAVYLPNAVSADFVRERARDFAGTFCAIVPGRRSAAEAVHRAQRQSRHCSLV